MKSTFKFFTSLGRRATSGDAKSPIFGHIDHLDATGVVGWIVDKSDFANRLTVEVLVDGALVVADSARLFRPDLREQGLSDGYSGFRLIFPAACFDGKKHKITVREASSGHELTSAPVGVKFPATPEIPAVIGLFENVTDSFLVSGWAWIPGRETEPVLDVHVNGTKVCSRPTTVRRPDLAEVGLAQARAGFKIRIPKDAVTSVQCRIDIAVNGQPLPGSPKTIVLDAGVTAKVKDVKNGDLHLELAGWRGGPLTAQVLVDGLPAGEARLAAAMSPAALAKGVWALPPDLCDGQPHLYVLAFSEGDTTLQSDPVILRYPPYAGWIDAVEADCVRGWALREDRHQALVLGLQCDGVPLPVQQHNEGRLDVAAKFALGQVKPGFALRLLDPLPDVSCTLAVVDAETGIVLVDIAVSNPHEAVCELAGLLHSLDGPAWSARKNAILAQAFLKEPYATRFDQRLLPPPPRPGRSETVDVIIPIYKGYLETVTCIESVLAAKNERPIRVILVDDCSPDEEISKYLDELTKSRRPGTLMVRRTVNGGFPAAVNMGICVARGNDVILLNSDTIVSDGWVDRLAIAAAQPRVGTVTPFTNNGEICSLPTKCRVNPVPTADITDQLNRVMSEVNAGRVAEMPVGVGFCLYIRRDCLDDVGLFDEERWGRGYGEEVDFCLKAASRGWRHVLCGDAFVAHQGSVSFGDEKLERIREGCAKINERYPFYQAMIEDYIKRDPISGLRRRANLALIATELRDCVLHVTHGLGGGTARYVKDMVALYRAENIPSIVLESKPGGTTLQVEVEDTPLVQFFGPTHSETMDQTDIEDFVACLRLLPITKVHVHSLLYLGPGVVDFLKDQYPCDVTVHDYTWICPRLSLSMAGGRYCGEPDDAGCNVCLRCAGAHDGVRRYLAAGEDIAAYRARFASFLSQAGVIFAGSSDVVERLRAHGCTGNFRAGLHPRTDSPSIRLDAGVNRLGDRIGIVVIGAISDIKGFHMIKACALQAAAMKLPLHFTIVGYTMDDGALADMANVTILGKYDEENLYDLVLDTKPVLAFQPNQCPETFSYTLSACFDIGLWPVVTDIGAQAERVRQTGFGTVVPCGIAEDDLVRILMEEAAWVVAEGPRAPAVVYPRTLDEYYAQDGPADPEGHVAAQQGARVARCVAIKKA